MTTLVDHRGQPMSARRRNEDYRILRAAADAGLNIPELKEHYAASDSLSANAAYSRDVRRKVREKSRYERNLNSYLCGILQTCANFVIGTGPRLQMTLTKANGKSDTERNRAIERDWNRWAKATLFADKLRTAIVTKRGDGESFLMGVHNPYIREKTGYGLDIVGLEAEQVETDDPTFQDDGGAGIKYDATGNPVEYPVKRKHPGDTDQYGDFSMTEPVEREYMVHLYRADRPGQKRGMSEILTALPLFALLRRMTLATIANIEKSANITGVLETEAELDFDDFGNPISTTSEDDWMTTIPTTRGSLLVLPNGQKMREFGAAQPNSQYDTFIRSLIREIARCISVPYNIAAGDSSEYNYSSGRLDHQSFFAANSVERAFIECECLDRVFALWFPIYAARNWGVDPEAVDVLEFSHNWFWDGVEHVDPAKAALSKETELKIGGTSRGLIHAKEGRDVDDIDERAAEELGFDSVKEYRQAIARSLYGAPSSTSSNLQKMVDGEEGERGRGRSTQEKTPEEATA